MWEGGDVVEGKDMFCFLHRWVGWLRERINQVGVNDEVDGRGPFPRCDKAEPCPSEVQQTCPTAGLISVLFSALAADGDQASLQGSRGRLGPR